MNGLRRTASRLAAMIFLPSLAWASPVLDSADGVVLPISQAGSLLHQCSRGAPQHVTGTWLPTPRQIRDLEERLPQALAEVNRHFTRFNRQYIGVLIAGRRMIYVNAFPRELVHAEKSDYVEAPEWRTSAVMVCDGGPEFFGVEFDPASGKFEDFDFNGRA